MSDDFENKLRRLVNEDVDARLGARRAAPDRAHRVSDRGHRNWMFPLVAAAAVAAVALGTFGAVQLLADDGHTAPPATKAPSTTPTSPTSSRTLASGRTIRLGTGLDHAARGLGRTRRERVRQPGLLAARFAVVPHAGEPVGPSRPARGLPAPVLRAAD